MKILTPALLAFLFCFFAGSTKAAPITTTNVSGHVSGSISFENFGIFNVILETQTPQDLVSSFGCCGTGGGILFDPSTGAFNWSFFVVDGGPEISQNGRVTSFEVEASGFGKVPAGTPPGSSFQLNGTTTVTGEYETTNLADNLVHRYTFTEPATLSLGFTIEENAEGSVVINFSGGSPTPEPMSLVLLVTGACFLVLRRNTWLAQGVKRQA